MKTKTVKRSATKKKAVSKKSDFERGKVEKLTLRKSLFLNNQEITVAMVELDHINYGLDRVTRKLNTRKRSDFTLSDVEKFLLALNGEYVLPKDWDSTITRHEFRVDCPVRGKHFGKQFIIIFELDFRNKSLIHTITLFRVGRK